MINEAQTRLKDHSKAPSSLSVCTSAYWGRLCLLGWERWSTSYLVLSKLIISPLRWA